jgi:uncharacterized damage-inducible protein DinB
LNEDFVKRRVDEMEVEPWLRGTLGEVEPLGRAVLHSLELAGEDVSRWCEGLDDEQMFARPAGLHLTEQGRSAGTPGLHPTEQGRSAGTPGLHPTEQGRSAGTPGLPPVAFHLRHIVRSLDRLLTYAEGGQLSREQMQALRTEMESEGMESEGSGAEVMAEFREGLRRAMERVRGMAPENFAEPRGVGRKMLATTVAGLLVHCADHTQRHVGQMVTTVKIVRAARGISI